MKKYIKPNSSVHEIDPVVFLIGAGTNVGYDDPMTKRNNDWQVEEEETDDGWW